MSMPKGWEEVRLSDISILKARIGWQGLKKSEFLEQGDYALVTGTDFKDGSIEWNSCVYVTQERYEQDTNIQLQNGDILITKDGTIGKVAYVENMTKPSTLNSGVFVLRPIDNAYHPKYLFYILNSHFFYDFMSRIVAGSTIVHLYQKDFKFFIFPLPPLKEQVKIAEILSSCDEHIKNLKNLKSELEKEKLHLMNELLSGKTRFSSFTTPWQEVKLSKILKERKEYAEKTDDIEHLTLSKEGVSPKTEQYDRDFLVTTDNKKYKVTHKNDICYNPANLKFGVICRNKYGSGIFSPIYVTFEVDENISTPSFMEYYVIREEFIKMVRKYEQGTVYERMAVSPKDFLSFKIKLPSLEEQKKIGEVLSACDERLQCLNELITAQTTLKSHLLTELLSGNLRVNI